ncbi:protein phosphatase 2C domain-containing protein [Cronbergia sp. UHCC 0137]|uniref:protein phosphatase 2C domain-containing protein n=1 Tax=Cronbergia sp. UHCC 0137 TaxID=3110239 RepID=UPI002B20AD69|nr:protein phosphatase 2C domain-containing protein [Cronbergia sp. UHCC 0137]MEA5621108.1 protein phosphatase 2C domain-containing protein [Cronbergia sp. UHCC 0137]
MSKFNLIISIEVAENKGEDANLAEDFGQTFLMGVFDGLGGRSAGYDGKTGGKIASTEASQITKKFFKQRYGQITPENVIELQKEICQSLKNLVDKNMSRTSSRLKGSLIEHKLCTTIALVSILKQQGQEKIVEANLAWMGDSRIYFLSPSKGLQQLTKDDLVTSKNALEMLRQDPPMSQYLTADIDPKWQIHFQHYKIQETGCFLACTDGCFQYFHAPWEFEKLLLETLSKSQGDKVDSIDWKELINQTYTDIKQDDISLIIYPVGFANPKHLRNTYQERLKFLEHNFISPNNNYDELQNMWEKYRINYESYFPLIQNTQSSLQPIHNRPIITHPSLTPDHTSITLTPASTFQSLNLLFTDKAANRAEEIRKLLDEANSCYRKFQFKEAEDLYNKVLEIDRHQSDPKYMLGLIYNQEALHETKYSEKIKLLDKASSLLVEGIEGIVGEEDKLIETYKILGFIYYQLSKWDRSVEYYVKCFKHNKTPEKFENWEEDLDAFVKSLNLSSMNASSRYEASNIIIQFCHHLINTSSYEKNASFYYFIAVLQETRQELDSAWRNINKAIEICNRSSGIKYENVQKTRQKYQEIQNKLSHRRY